MECENIILNQLKYTNELSYSTLKLQLLNPSFSPSIHSHKYTHNILPSKLPIAYKASEYDQ